MAMHTWPLVTNAASNRRLASPASTTTSGASTAASFPPSSNTTGRVVPAAVAMTACPVGTPPVKETMSTSGWATRAAPSSAWGPLTTLSTPGGRASAMAAATSSTVPGQVGGALTTMVLPVRSAGKTLLAITETGQLKGRMAPTTPCGTRLNRGGSGLVRPGRKGLGRHRCEPGGHGPHGAGIELGLPVDLPVLSGQQAGQIVPFNRRHHGGRGRDGHAGAILRSARRPGRERTPRRRHGVVQLLSRGGGGIEHHLGGAGRIGHRVGPGCPGHYRPVDDQSESGHHVVHVLSPVPPGLGTASQDSVLPSWRPSERGVRRRCCRILSPGSSPCPSSRSTTI